MIYGIHSGTHVEGVRVGKKWFASYRLHHVHDPSDIHGPQVGIVTVLSKVQFDGSEISFLHDPVYSDSLGEPTNLGDLIVHMTSCPRAAKIY
jgi:hypothetical protein